MKYRVKEELCELQDPVTNEWIGPHTYFIVQVKFLWFWITVKEFVDEDPDYAKNCAEELLDKLVEEI